MAQLRQKNIKAYDKLMKELDVILSEKRISYAQFAVKMGIQTVAFYNRYKVYGFLLEDMENFVEMAKCLPPNRIKCIKCDKEFVPKAKSVKRAFCNECRQEMQKKDNGDNLKFRYPAWVNNIKNIEIRKLVEQEFHIDEVTASNMAKAKDVAEAKKIRAERWQDNSVILNNFSKNIKNIEY